MSISNKLQSLQPLFDCLLLCKTVSEKIAVLNSYATIPEFLSQHEMLTSYLNNCSQESEFAIKSILAIDQGPIVFSIPPSLQNANDKMLLLIQNLTEIEKFYSFLGGIIGYHLTILTYIHPHKVENLSKKETTLYSKPAGINLSSDSLEISSYVIKGIKNLPDVAEIYPVGGAGDRLDLHDEISGEALPAACLLFGGRTLLEGLIRDLQAREYLHFQLFGKQIITPIAMMTSSEKNNHNHIIKICEEQKWFGRPQTSFFFFTQPLAPVITKDGNWSLNTPLNLYLKPGGHGVMWKLAQESGVFNWLSSKNRHKALIRQINNPIAGTDNSLLAFTGIGTSENKKFGFASCPRLIQAAEGMLVQVEEDTEKHCEYHISNIEYTEFSKKGLEDAPCQPGSPYSAFPANTNILFADLASIQKALIKCPIPGMIVNMKSCVPYIDSKGTVQKIKGGRLESTMQNISDYIKDTYSKRRTEIQPTDLSTFITYNERVKTISTTKNSFVQGEKTQETPESCYYDVLQNAYDALKNYCKMEIPTLTKMQDYILEGPTFVANWHPALGPLYSVIAQKIRGGHLAKNAEMQLEISDLEMEQVNLDGSLLILADSVMGKNDSLGNLQYSHDTGKCTLVRVRIKNKGIKKSECQRYWKNEIVREESLKIVLKGNGEFFAKDVTFTGHHVIQVPDGHRVIAREEEGKLLFTRELLKAPTCHWKYSIDSDEIIIEKHVVA